MNCGQVLKLYLDVVLRRPPSIEGEEAKAMYDQLMREVQAMQRAGISPEIPNELPD